jgi:hypothetical protein
MILEVIWWRDWKHWRYRVLRRGYAPVWGAHWKLWSEPQEPYVAIDFCKQRVKVPFPTWCAAPIPRGWPRKGIYRSMLFYIQPWNFPYSLSYDQSIVTMSARQAICHKWDQYLWYAIGHDIRDESEMRYANSLAELSLAVLAFGHPIRRRYLRAGVVSTGLREEKA